MSIKIVNRSTIAMQTVLFICLSLLFLLFLEGGGAQKLLAQGSLVAGLGVFISILAVIFVWSGKRIGQLFLILLFGLVLYKLGLFMFKGGFSKLGLVFFMIYFFSAAIFWNLWKLELQGPVYNNTLSEAFSLKHPGEYDFEIWLEDRNGTRKEGRLVDWDDSSCFIFSEDKEKLKGKVAVNVHFEGHVFRDTGIIASRLGDSLGIRFLKGKKPQPELSFESFYAIIKARGYYNRFTESSNA